MRARPLEVSALIAIALLLAPASAPADTFTYDHEGRDLFSLTFPDGWFVDTDYADEARAAGGFEGGEPEIRIVEAMPGDGTKLWFGVWVIPRASTLERGLEYVASLDGELFTDVEISEPRETALGGMRARALSGNAKRDGEEVELAVVLFEPRPEVIAAALYVGRPDTWKEHEGELQGIVDSVEPAR